MSKQVKLFWVVTLVTIGWMILMRPFTPSNIVRFELAKVVSAAQQIIDDWGNIGILNARLSIYLDFVFIFFYSWTLSLGCNVSSIFSANKNLIVAGSLFSRVVWFAGSCDIIENLAMLFTLSTMNELTVSMAFYFAVIKFTILALTLVFIVSSISVGFFKAFKKD